jgi:hypothetical protein
MLSLANRLDTIEANLTLISNIISESFTDGTIDVNDDELGAVLEEIFEEIRNIEKRILTLQEQLTMVENILAAAQRK